MFFVLQYMCKLMLHPPRSCKELFFFTGNIDGFTYCDRVFLFLNFYSADKFCQAAVFHYSELLRIDIGGNDSKQKN